MQLTCCRLNENSAKESCTVAFGDTEFLCDYKKRRSMLIDMGSFWFADPTERHLFAGIQISLSTGMQQD